MKSSVVVRLATAEDIPAIAYVQSQSWKGAFADILTEQALAKYTNVELCTKILQNAYTSGIGRLYGAWCDGVACGELFWRIDHDELVGYAEIVALHSLPTVWGKGVGRAMMDVALADIAAAGLGRCYLWVFRDNARARSFYEKCGFTPDGAQKLSSFGDAVEVRYVRSEK